MIGTWHATTPHATTDMRDSSPDVRSPRIDGKSASNHDQTAQDAQRMLGSAPNFVLKCPWQRVDLDHFG